jgi:indole-3-glycerol phosphate synthase
MAFLNDLMDSTRERVAQARLKITDEVMEQRIASVPAARSLESALLSAPMTLIAEIKRATPSKGALDLELDPRKLADAYVSGGAAAISVLTEPSGFKGSLDDLQAATGAGVPVLRKDFIVDPWQISEARAWGADCVLLIVRCAGDALAELHSTARAFGMDALVEVANEAEVESALELGASMIGINHRDLETFEVDPQRTAKLAPIVGTQAVVVALSGVSERSEVEALAEAGARSVLVGESLVTAADPAAKIKELLGR